MDFFKLLAVVESRSRVGRCEPVAGSTPGLPVPPCLPEFAQVHAHCIHDAIRSSHPLMPSPSARHLPQYRGLSSSGCTVYIPRRRR